MKKALVAVVAGGTLLVTGAPALAKPTLGPYGYGAVKLGMSAKKAKATGRIVPKMPAGEGACSGWDLKAHPTGKNSVDSAVIVILPGGNSPPPYAANR